ncbi:MAG TPA: regulatory protein RecX [Chitinophagaceae bacterium]|nr:regulatory protein RecX [Chitinophagaceae bacterium]
MSKICMMATPLKTSLSREQALQKLKHYCAYQERCHQEVKEKLYSLEMHKQDVEIIISQLIEENYLNEERFAIQYAGSKFRIKHWGKVKIKHALKQKQVSEYCIRKAIGQIDEDDYMKTLQKLGATKWNLLAGEKNIFVKKRKMQDFLLQKGFETDLVKDVLDELSKQAGK